MGRRGSRIWVPLVAALLVVAFAIVDAVTGDAVVLVPMYVLGPLFAALVASPRATAAVGLLASLLGIYYYLADQSDGQDLVRLATVVLGSALAVWIAVLRDRLRRNAGLLDVIFERAPIGLALMNTELRYVRVNQRLAEINGIPPEDHLGTTIAELLPDLPTEVHADMARVARPASR